MIVSYYRQLSADFKMKQILILLFLFHYSWKIVCYTILYMISQNGWEPVLIQWTFIGFADILEMLLKFLLSFRCKNANVQFSEKYATPHYCSRQFISISSFMVTLMDVEYTWILRQGKNWCQFSLLTWNSVIGQFIYQILRE